MIEVLDVGRVFGDVVAVDHVSFRVGAGEVVGLLGANGAGKTTTMRMILGLLRPTSGRVELDGRPAAEVDRRLIGYVPQSLGLYRDLTVLENLSFISAAFGAPLPALDGAGLGDIGDRRVGELSLGLRRRVAFLAALSHSPEVLILDEPTSGVGPLGRARLWESIHNAADEGASVLVSTHHMEEAEECDRVVLMADGREVVSGVVSEIVSGFSSVLLEGEVGDEVLREIRARGGKVLVDRSGWRVVGLGPGEIGEAVGPSVTVARVPATFEEVFVALSRESAR